MGKIQTHRFGPEFETNNPVEVVNKQFKALCSRKHSTNLIVVNLHTNITFSATSVFLLKMM